MKVNELTTSAPPALANPTGVPKRIGRMLLCVTLGALWGNAHAESLTFTHFAGPAGGHDSIDGTGSTARFHLPEGVAVDGAGNVYVADTANHTIRKITPEGHVSTLAGAAGSTGSADGKGSGARFSNPAGLALDAIGNVYVCDGSTIRRITPAGRVTTLAGNPVRSGSADGTGAGARFNSPSGIAVDTFGNLYVADTNNHTVRRLTSAGIVTTIAGTAGTAGNADGAGAAAQFKSPRGVGIDGSGNLYVSDAENSTIRKITPAGMVTTLAGKAGSVGSSDGTGSAARFAMPGGVAVGVDGSVYVADLLFHRIRKITRAGVVTTLAGGNSGSFDGVGSHAEFHEPTGLAVDGNGNVYVADSFNGTIRKVTPAGLVTTLAGMAASSGSDDGPGPAARFAAPSGMAIDAGGMLYVADLGNDTVRRITPAGLVTTLAGSAGSEGSNDGNGRAARFKAPNGVAVDGSGNVYVADTNNHTIRKITADGAVTTLAGTAGVAGSFDGTGIAARFNHPRGVAVDGNGTVFVADTGNHEIRRISPDGAVTTVAGTAGSTGGTDGSGSEARFSSPFALAIDASGNVIVAEFGNHTIRRITLDGVVTTVAGTARAIGSVDGTGSAARFHSPTGVAFDAAGNIIVADQWNHVLRRITPSGVVTTLAGQFGTPGNTDGSGRAARFYDPRGLAIDADGNLYVAEVTNNGIRKGLASIGDTATIDASEGPVGLTRQLGTEPRTASSWRWHLTRRPAESEAELSSSEVNDPTFTPDVAGLYVFRLQASTTVGAQISTVSLLAFEPLRRRAVRH